jgi:hypothetical protein
MKNRLSNTSLIASAIVATAVTGGAADTRWSRVSPEGAGFSAEAPGEPQPSEPGQYSYSSGLWFYCVKLIPVDPGTRILVERGDKKALKTRLESSRNSMVATVNATSDRSSYGELDGYPSLRFSLATEELAGTNLLVLTGEHMYMVMTVGPKGAKDDDAKRFLASFRLTTDAAGRTTMSSPAAGGRQ